MYKSMGVPCIICMTYVYTYITHMCMYDMFVLDCV